MILGFKPRGRHLLLYDVAATALSIVIAFGVRFDANDIGAVIRPYLPAALLPLLVLPPVYIAFGLYRREWRYASVREMFAIAAAVIVGTGVTFAIFLALAVFDVGGTSGFPRSIFVIEALLNVAFVGGGRFLLRASLERSGIAGEDGAGSAALTLIYGAGEAGATIARLALRDASAGLAIAGFLDDDRHKRGSRLMGSKVFGGLESLERAASMTGARQLLIAMPSASGKAIRAALQAGQAIGLEVRTVPPLSELVRGEVQLSKIRKVSVEDLLRREPIAMDMAAVAGYLNGANVLVTGGGGSIGSELARQILAVGPRSLTVVDHHEWTLWEIGRELSGLAADLSGAQVQSILTDIRSAAAVDALIRRIRPEVIFHAAALKHVPIVEQFPTEGAMTNVLGTRNVLLAAERFGVGRFVLISTDKAVEPTSVMGATKRMAEQLTVAAAVRTDRPYTAVRFGNVLGSSGSVVPIFQRQLENGLPLTITHPDATRYFMTVGEAVSLILEASATAVPGDVYVLDMGQPIKIVDLARDLIRLAGADPDDVEIVYTGLRPGERLHETLFHQHESAESTNHAGILRVRSDEDTDRPDDLDDRVDRLEKAATDRDDAAIRRILGVMNPPATPADHRVSFDQAAR